MHRPEGVGNLAINLSCVRVNCHPMTDVIVHLMQDEDRLRTMGHPPLIVFDCFQCCLRTTCNLFAVVFACSGNVDRKRLAEKLSVKNRPMNETKMSRSTPLAFGQGKRLGCRSCIEYRLTGRSWTTCATCLSIVIGGIARSCKMRDPVPTSGPRRRGI